MSADMREGVTADAYLAKMDRAGIDHSLLTAVRAGDMDVRGSFEVPYTRVADVCRAHPARFSGLAGIDPFRGMQGLRDLEQAVRHHGSSARICIHTGLACRQTPLSTTHTLQYAANLTFPS